MHHPSSRKTLDDLIGDTSGAAMTEYLITVGVVGLVLAVGIVARGDMLLFDYTNARDLFLVPAL
jgi:Flp pilus assembly pilin Flp